MTSCIRAGLGWKTSWLFMPFAIALGVLIGARFISPLIDGPPTYLLESRVIETEIHAGGSLRFRVVSRSREGRNCMGYITRELQRRVVVDGESIWEKRRMVMAPAPIPDVAEDRDAQGAATYVIVVPVPADTEPGDWRFKGRTTYDCGFWLGGIHVFDTPFLHFHVRVPSP